MSYGCAAEPDVCGLEVCQNPYCLPLGYGVLDAISGFGAPSTHLGYPTKPKKSTYAVECLFRCAWVLGTTTFVNGSPRGSRDRVRSGCAGAHGSREIQWYVCSAARWYQEIRHFSLPMRIGVEKELGSMVLVRTGVEKYNGMFVPLLFSLTGFVDPAYF